MNNIENVMDSIKLKGYFKVETLDINDNVTETFEDNNMIMDNARVNLATGISGFAGGVPITQIAFGTQGNVTGDVTTPKTVANGFISSRTDLFSEQNAGFTYYINFVPTTNGGFATVTETDVGAGSTVQITLTNTNIQYIVEMSQTAGNNSSNVKYTEAAFYCGSNIFSAKCFPVRVKDTTVKLRVYWSFTF